MEFASVKRVFRRLISAAAVFFLASVLAFAFALTPLGTFFARRAVVMLHIGEPGTVWKGAIPMLMGIAGTFVYSLPFAVLLVLATRWRKRPMRSVMIGTIMCWGLVVALLVGSWQIAVVSVVLGFAVIMSKARDLLSSSHH